MVVAINVESMGTGSPSRNPTTGRCSRRRAITSRRCTAPRIRGHDPSQGSFGPFDQGIIVLMGEVVVVVDDLVLLLVVIIHKTVE